MQQIIHTFQIAVKYVLTFFFLFQLSLALPLIPLEKGKQNFHQCKKWVNVTDRSTAHLLCAQESNYLFCIRLKSVNRLIQIKVTFIVLNCLRQYFIQLRSNKSQINLEVVLFCIIFCQFSSSFSQRNLIYIVQPQTNRRNTGLMVLSGTHLKEYIDFTIGQSICDQQRQQSCTCVCLWFNYNTLVYRTTTKGIFGE